MDQKSEKGDLTIRVSAEAAEMLATLSARMGVSGAVVVETLLRDASRSLETSNIKAASNSPADLTGYHQTPRVPFDEWVREIEALGPLSPAGVSIPDEALTSESLYADHS